MRAKDKTVLFDVADRFSCWIGVREPNPLSERWIGVPGYLPKGLDCKAKSADNPGHPFAGLVVDPTQCPGAFRSDTLALAEGTWANKFLVGGRPPRNFTVMEHGPEAGLVKKNNARLYADFDLMAICKAGANGEFLQTTFEEQKALFSSVGPALNEGFGTPMVQHGTEFMWDQGVGAREFELVFWFGPGHRFTSGPSSMPQGGH